MVVAAFAGAMGRRPRHHQAGCASLDPVRWRLARREPLSGQRRLERAGGLLPGRGRFRRRDEDDDRRRARRPARSRRSSCPRTQGEWPRRPRFLTAAGSWARTARVRPEGERTTEVLRLPLVGSVVGHRCQVAGGGVEGRRRSLSGPERGFRAHLNRQDQHRDAQGGRVPLWAAGGAIALRGGSGLSANCSTNSTRVPGGALKAFLLASLVLGRAPRRALAVAVLIAPYDLREMAMLGERARTRSAPGKVEVREGFAARRTIRRDRALAGLTPAGERRSLGGS